MSDTLCGSVVRAAADVDHQIIWSPVVIPQKCATDSEESQTGVTVMAPVKPPVPPPP